MTHHLDSVTVKSCLPLASFSLPFHFQVRFLSLLFNNVRSYLNPSFPLSTLSYGLLRLRPRLETTDDGNDRRLRDKRADHGYNVNRYLEQSYTFGLTTAMASQTEQKNGQL